jgi:hypothetical protein
LKKVSITAGGNKKYAQKCPIISVENRKTMQKVAIIIVGNKKQRPSRSFKLDPPKRCVL